MKHLLSLTALASLTAAGPCSAQASWVALSDAELRAVQGQGFVSDPSLFPQEYRATLTRMWTGLNTVQGRSALLHYAGMGTIIAGYAFGAPALATAAAVIDNPPPPGPLWVLTTMTLTAPPIVAGGSLMLAGGYMLQFNGG
jgi:hypothetical protein